MYASIVCECVAARVDVWSDSVLSFLSVVVVFELKLALLMAVFAVVVRCDYRCWYYHCWCYLCVQQSSKHHYLGGVGVVVCGWYYHRWCYLCFQQSSKHHYLGGVGVVGAVVGITIVGVTFVPSLLLYVHVVVQAAVHVVVVPSLMLFMLLLFMLLLYYC